jgi:polyphenol oxidase
MQNLFSKKMSYGTFSVFNDRPDFNLQELTQTHSSLICTPNELPCEADGIITFWEENVHPIVIKTADCLPVIIEGKKGVCLIHAGWKGLQLGILKNEKIQSIEPENAFIGPCIHSCCFEVSEDFKMNFPRSLHFIKRNNSLYFSLVGEAFDQIEQTYSIKAINSDICTCCNPLYNSYRRDKTSKRNFNIYLKGN